MHATTVLRLALPCLALALFAKAEGHGRFQKNCAKASHNQSGPLVLKDLPANVDVEFYPNDGDFPTWFNTFAAFPNIQLSVLTYDGWGKFDMNTFIDNCIPGLEADAFKAVENSGIFPLLVTGSAKLPDWYREDGVLLVVCQAFGLPAQTKSHPSADFTSNEIMPYPSHVDLAIKRINLGGFNVSLAATGTSIKDVLQKAAKNNVRLNNGLLVSPSDSGPAKGIKKVVGKGDKHGAEKGDGDDKWSDGDKGKKGEAFHKDRKSSKQP